MFNLLKVISDRLEGTGYSVFFNEKNEDTDYPFVVFNLPTSNEGTNIHREDFSLEVDIWTKDIVQCIDMTNTIKTMLDWYQYIDDKLQASFYFTNRLNNIPDEDNQIKRSQLRFQVNTYKANK